MLISESLLIVASLGVTVKRTSMLGTTSQYFDISQIKDIVIIETISMVSLWCACFVFMVVRGVNCQQTTHTLLSY